MSSRGSRGRGSSRRHGHPGGARVESSSIGTMPNLKTNETIGTPTAENRF